MRVLEWRLIGALEKVFPDEALRAPARDAASALPGEVHAFQLALRCPSFDYRPAPFAFHRAVARVEARACGGLDVPVRVREVKCVPVDVACLQHDPHLLRESPGLYPDALVDAPGGFCSLADGAWRSFWIDLRIPEDAAPGRREIRVSIEDVGVGRNESNPPVEAVYSLEILPAALAPQRLLRNEWFHADCLADYYRVEAWSEEHWRVVEAFVKNAAAHGINTLLTPLWNPPLDTAPGHKRTSAQLLDIEYADGRYRFDFSRLKRWIDMARRAGVTHFAMSHAFTQWGAAFTPRVTVRENGVAVDRFGWHVASDDPAYAEFLRALMAELLPFLKNEGLGPDRVFFAVSDEPTETQIDTYAKAAKLLASLIGDYPTLEALSRFEFYKRGLVTIPVPANNHIEDFVGKTPKLWTYYCVGQEEAVPNRFMAMPSARNRIMGVLFYLYRIEGFLQWGFNFYNSQYSFEKVDPWRDTCANRWVPAGDAFMVYPGADGEPVDSLRHEVFFQGLQDLRALEALEGKIGREAVEALIHEGRNKRLSMTDYPRSAEWLLDLRERVNRRLAAAR